VRRREFVALLGSALASSPVAQAQQPLPVIGWLSIGSPESDNAIRVPGFRQGLEEIGYMEGQNVAIEYRWPQGEGEYDRLPAIAADMVRRRVALIAAIGGAPPAFAAKAATATIPIVFTLGVDPVRLGLIASLNRPGGNITGVTGLSAELIGKRLDLLHEVLPTATVVAVLINPANRTAFESETSNLQDAALTLGLQLDLTQASTASEIDAAFESIVKSGAGALVVSGDTFFTNRKDQIVTLAARYAIPAAYVWPEFAVAGGLMSYGTDRADAQRQAGVLAGKILKGAKPADLPVQQSVKFELVINLKTAKTLGLTIPPYLLARADEVIE